MENAWWWGHHPAGGERQMFDCTPQILRQYRIILSADTASEVRHLELCSVALESVAYSRTFAFLPRRDDGPPPPRIFCQILLFSPLTGQKSGIRRCNPLKIIVK